MDEIRMNNLKILKQCLMCGNMFEAQKVTTAYCSHKCNSKHYKLKRKLKCKEAAEAPIKQPQLFKPKVSALNKAIFLDKEFLSVKELALLFNCTPKTIRSFIEKGIIPATKLSQRITIIRRSNIDKLFDKIKA